MRLATSLSQAIKTGSGAVVVGLPGMGVSHYLEIFAKQMKLPLTDGSSEVAGEVVILNPDFLGNSRAIERVVRMYQKAGTEQKIILGVNAPAVLYSSELSSPQISSRWYGMHWLETRDRGDLGLLAEELAVKLTTLELEKLEEITGGVARFAKYFILNKEKMEKSAEELWEDSDWRRMAKPFLTEAKKCKGEWLTKMELVDGNGVWKSAYLSTWMKEEKGSLAVGVEGEVWLVELGEKIITLMPFEVKIVRYLIDHDGVIEKDKIAELKWGNATEGVSDQAIAKSMQRLGGKFRHHVLKPIPKIGYQLILK